MRIFKSHPLLKLVNSYVIDSPQPSNLSYLWNFGSLLALCLIIQIITGVTLAMHYNPSVSEAFNSIEHIMRDVNNGWLIRYLHSNTASAFFFLVYLHIGRGLYYGYIIFDYIFEYYYKYVQGYIQTYLLFLIPVLNFLISCYIFGNNIDKTFLVLSLNYTILWITCNFTYGLFNILFKHIIVYLDFFLWSLIPMGIQLTIVIRLIFFF